MGVVSSRSRAALSVPDAGRSPGLGCRAPCLPPQDPHRSRDVFHTSSRRTESRRFRSVTKASSNTFVVAIVLPFDLGGSRMRLRQRQRQRESVVPVIGDGAMTQVWPTRLNHRVGWILSPTSLVVLNDNRMSISETSGGLTKMLGRLTGSRTLNALRESGKKTVRRHSASRGAFMRRCEEHWKGIFRARPRCSMKWASTTPDRSTVTISGRWWPRSRRCSPQGPTAAAC